MKSKIYLIPCFLDEEAPESIPAYVTEAVTNCDAFFVENERTARRYLKQLWKACLPEHDITIDNYQWFAIGKMERAVQNTFRQKIQEGKNLGIMSEAGCPGIADPGQELIAIAHEM